LIPLCAALATACATTATRPEAPQSRGDLLWIARVTYGVDSRALEEVRRRGRAGYLDTQLSGTDAPLPEVIGRQIEGLHLDESDAAQIVTTVTAEYRRINALPDGADKEQARRTLGEQGNKLAYAAVRRDLLRAIYSPSQLKEQMVWFWLNHFSVSQYKANVRWVIADYEEHAIRPHVFGHFRDLVMATLTHPAMLQYLDNAQNAQNHVNENYARELMELHTLGVDGGYTQADVQELARVLTGVGIRLRPDAPAPVIRPALRGDYVRQGLFEFNPNRHDYGPKTLLGQPMTKQGLAEVDEALDRLARAPATARFISRKLAVYFVADDPPPELVARMADTFRRTDGDIAATLQTMFESPEFTASLGRKFRDPAHYVIAGVRLASDGRVISNVNPVLFWIARMGEPLYAHETPDGYPLTQDAWASAGQMNTRFEVARAIGTNGAVLFRRDDEAADAQPVAMPRLADAPTVRVAMLSLSADTREALAQAKSPQDWNTFLLASPEWMHR